MQDPGRLQTINVSRVLRTLRLSPRTSRIRISEELGLDRSTVTKIVRNLMEKDIIRTAGKKSLQSGAGRKQIELVVNGEFGAVLGLEIQRDRWCGVVSFLDGRILRSFSGKFPAPLSRDTLVSAVASVLAETGQAARQDGLRLLGAGIALPGVVDPYGGAVVRSFPLGVDSPLPLRDALAEDFPGFLFLENDANCCCWGELAFHPEDRNRNFIAVLGEFNRESGFAVGMGFVVRERVLHGDHFTAGEFRSLFRSAGNRTQFSFSVEELSGLPGNKKQLKKVYRELCTNLAFLVNGLDFTKIVFAGDIPVYRDFLPELLEAAVAEGCIYDIPKSIQTVFASAGEFSVALGAAGLFTEKLFSVPDMSGSAEGPVGYDLFSRILDGGVNA